MKSPINLDRFDTEKDRILSVKMDVDALESKNLQKFIETLQIITKTEGLRSLIMNTDQEKVWNMLQEHREAKKRFWALILKHRRRGMSTLFTAICFALCYWYPYRRSRIVAHDWPGASYLWSMVQTYWRYLPKELRAKRPLESDTKKMLRWKTPHDSWIQVGSANTRNLASSELVHYCHFSEYAKYQDPHDMMLSILQTIPDHWDTINVMEFTAQGKNHAYQWWKAAEKNEIDYQDIFITWKGSQRDIGECWAQVPENFVLNEEEKEFQMRWEVEDGQMAWLQNIKRDKCHNDWAEFNQEYPIDASVAFKVSGFPWFTDLEWQEPKEPIATGSLDFITEKDPAVDWKDTNSGFITIWAWPTLAGLYVIGMDVAEGVGAAYTVIQVLRVLDDGSTEQVAKYRSNRIGASLAAVEVFKLAVFYRRAFVGVERNNHGHDVLDHLKDGHAQFPQTKGGYPFLYYHTIPATKHREETQRLGWQTDKATRPVLFNSFRDVVSHRQTKINCQITLTECEGIQWDVTNQKWVQEQVNPEKHLALDDEVMSYGIALQMARHHREHRFLPKAQEGTY